MDADGSNVKQLTFSNGYNDFPAWAPDGRRLAFSADGGIAIMDLDNLRATDLMGPARWATYAVWSPDGQRLAFYAFSVSQDEGGLYVESVDGNDVTRLTNGHDVQPDWSPDGHHIVFLHGETVFSNPTLRVIEADGSNPVDILPEEPLRRSPKWSPDGRQVIFGRHYLVDVSKAEQAWRDAVFMVNTDGSGLRLVIQPSGDVWGWERGALLPMPRGVMYGKVDWCKVR
jgi:TolB protein